MLSLVYVSRSACGTEDRSKHLDDIQAVSIARNTELDITGLLIATVDHFAQLLEGPSAGVDAVMRSIVADPRHQEVRIVRRIEVPARRYPHWRMARFDGETFGAVKADPLLAACHKGDDSNAIASLNRLIDAIAVNRAPRLH